MCKKDNEYPLGECLTHWQAPPVPELRTLTGHYCQLEKLDTHQHAHSLWNAFAEDTQQALWRYLPCGPFSQIEALIEFLEQCQSGGETLLYAIIDKQYGCAKGFIGYSRIQHKVGSIEVSHVCLSPQLQKTTAATEAIYLMIKHCFELGYRRCEWKCNSLNFASQKAALRLGFTYEGCFRQATIVKGRNRDTHWHCIIDKEWPPLIAAYDAWLSRDNFSDSGQQKQRLGEFIIAATLPTSPLLD